MYKTSGSASGSLWWLDQRLEAACPAQLQTELASIATRSILLFKLAGTAPPPDVEVLICGILDYASVMLEARTFAPRLCHLSPTAATT
jgi:hypothetical protein